MKNTDLKTNIKNKKPFCTKQGQHQSEILLVCLNPKCQKERMCCLSCLDTSHNMHDLISIHKFKSMIQHANKNNENPDKQKIYLILQQTQTFLQNKIQEFKNSFLSELTQCENKMHKYFNQLHLVLSMNSNKTQLQYFQHNFGNQVINDFIQSFETVKGISFGNAKQTKTMTDYVKYIFTQKFQQVQESMKDQMQQLIQYFDMLKIPCKKIEQDDQFSQQFRPSVCMLSDSRRNNGNITLYNCYPVCLFNRPFDPINNTAYIKIQKCKTKKSIWLGACIFQIVKGLNFKYCNGFNKGVYAIDQNVGYSYNNSNQDATTWNHHISGMNQSSYSSNNSSVGWNFKEEDIIKIEINYQERLIIFYKLNQENEFDEDLAQVFSMPIKTDIGQLYPFVGAAGMDDKVSILSKQQINQLTDESNTQLSQDNIDEVNEDEDIFMAQSNDANNVEQSPNSSNDEEEIF